jgi:hypothetical protein
MRSRSSQGHFASIEFLLPRPGEGILSGVGGFRREFPVTVVSSWVRFLGFSSSAIGTLVLAGGTAISASASVAQPGVPIPANVTASTPGVGTVRCDSKGFFDGGKISLELSGQTDADLAQQPKSAGDPAAANVTCQLIQGHTVLATDPDTGEKTISGGKVVVQANRTAGGRFSGQMAGGQIELVPTVVCASGFVVRSNGTASKPENFQIAKIKRVCK